MTTENSAVANGPAGKVLSTPPGGRSAAFEAWVSSARPRARVWRLVLGLLLAVLIWVLWQLPILFGYAIWKTASRDPEAINPDTVTADLEASLMGGTAEGTLVMLATFAGLWIGVWAAMALLHRQKLGALLSPERRLRLLEFGAGVLIGGIYLGAGVALSLATGVAPYRTELSITHYLLFFGPVVLLLLIQTSAEEALFRGYFVQQLAARFRNPLIWGGLPALAFGLLHYVNGAGISTVFGVYYVAATFLIAIIATVLVWRTGSLAAAMGLHFINNAGIMLGVGADDAFKSTQLWLWPADVMAEQAPLELVPLLVLLLWVASPLAPLPKPPQRGLVRNETRAAP